MLFFLSDFILASFTNISSYLIILSWLKKDLFYFTIEGLILSLIYHNFLYIIILFIIYIVNKVIKLKVYNLKNYYFFFLYNYFLFNLLIWVITKGFLNNLFFNLAFNLLLIYPCYKLNYRSIKLNR